MEQLYVRPIPLEIYRVYPISCGRKRAYIDEKRLSDVSKHKWYDTNNYVMCVANNPMTKTGRKTIMLHRFLMGLCDGSGNKICDCECNYQVDHINRNALDNRVSNFRVCVQSLNNKNRTVNKNKKSSKYLGVTFDKSKRLKKKWKAAVSHNGKQTHTPLFLTEKEAALAYNELAKKLHGEYANLNIIN